MRRSARANRRLAAMSPHAALLVIACAVPLAVAWDCIYIQKAAQPRVYNFIKANNNTGFIKPEVKDSIIVIEDMCMQDDAVVVGVKIQICDDDIPDVTIPYEYPIWSMTVSRKTYGQNAATVDVLQYCQRGGACKYSEVCTNPPVVTDVKKIVTYDQYEKDKHTPSSSVPLTDH